MYGGTYSTNYAIIIIGAIVFLIVFIHMIYSIDEEEKINAKRRAKYSRKSRYEK